MNTPAPPDDQAEIAELRRVQQELRESEARYRLIVESASDGIVTIDHHGRITEFNPAAKAILGWERSQVIGRDLSDTLIPPAAREAHRQGLMRHLQSPKAPPVRMELSALRSDGAEVPIELTVSVASGGSLPTFTALIRDLTARRQTEAEGQRVADQLRASESQYRSLFLDNSQPMCVYDPETLRFLAVNTAAIAQYGYSEAEFMGMTIESLCPEEDLAAWRREALTRPRLGRVQHDARHRRKNGEVVYVQSFSNDILFQGQPARVVLALDVTAQRRAAIDLSRSEARFRALTQLSADWYWEQDEHFRFVEVKGGTRYPPRVPPAVPMLGRRRWELGGDTEAEGGWDAHRRQLERHEPFRDFLVRRRDPDGTLHLLSLSGSPIFDKAGRFTGYRGVGSDITERLQAQEMVTRLNSELEEQVSRRTAELKAAHAELKAFSYSIAHDLRSPLTSIDGFSRVLAELHGASMSDQGRHYLRRIRAGVQQMGELTDAMLSLAHLSGVDLRWETVDLAEIARAVVRRLAELEPQRDAQLEAPEHLYAQGDPRLLSQVMTNLVNNAWKFSARKPQTRITVGSTTGVQGETEYFVADQGAGFDMAHASRLFGAFQRLHASNEFTGTGIGLALVQKIITRHAGRVWANASPDEGATFYFTLGPEPPP